MIRPATSAPALRAVHALHRTQRDLFQTMRRLATGTRINRGADDPAGLIASERLAAAVATLEAENRSLERANANATIADGNAAELAGLFTDLRSLVIAGSNEAGLSDAERAAYQDQINNVVDSVQRFHGGAVDSLSGFNMPGTGNANVETLYNDALATALSVRSGGPNDLASGNYAAASAALENAATHIATARGRIGAYQRNQIQPSIRSNQIAIENLTESRSRIADTDYVVELSRLASQQVVARAGIQALLATQQQTRSILDLFR